MRCGAGIASPVPEPSSPELRGRVALVTGATRGIGRAVARELAGRGAAVAFTYRQSEELAASLTRELAAEGAVGLGVQAPEGCREACRAAHERLSDFARIGTRLGCIE